MGCPMMSSMCNTSVQRSMSLHLVCGLDVYSETYNAPDISTVHCSIAFSCRTERKVRKKTRMTVN